MKKKIIAAILAALLTPGCSNEQPVPAHPITITALPRSTVKVTGNWKMGEFVIGYRIITDEYVIASDGGGLIGQEGQALVGPAGVRYSTVTSFGPIFDIAEKVTSKEPITFYGELAYTCEGQPYMFEDKKVIYLYNATHNGQDYEVNRRPWDN